MCIFSRPVESVTTTRIFARLGGNGTQYLAYEMNYESREPNAMILPLPVREPASADALRFIDLKEYGGFFTDLASGFPFHASRSFGCSAKRTADPGSILTVHEVGDFVASFVPTIADFDRLDPRFRLPRETWAKLPGSDTFGFAAFQLAEGARRPHPMAFAFRTSSADIFFPTVHIHDGQVHAREEFDHVLYLQHAGLDSRVGSYENAHVQDASTGLIRSKFRAEKFCQVDKASGLLSGNLLVHRKFLRGHLPNQDTWIAVTGDPDKAGFNSRPLKENAAPLTLLGALAWIFNRRTRLKSLRRKDAGHKR